jgi:cobalt-zinc-cadmium resistance protein CzcA
MLNRIITFSLEHRPLVLMLAGVLIVTGVMAFRALPIDAFPDTTPVMVQVNTTAPALSPEEIEAQITFPIEQAISGLPGLDQVRSLSKFGLSQVTVLFADGTDILRARQLVTERLGTADLPDRAGVDRPELGPISTGLGEVYHYLLTSDRHSLTELRTIQDWIVKVQLRSVAGVAEVNSWGGYEQQYHVLVDPSLLIKYDLTLDAVVQALEANNANVGGGNIQQAGEVYLVQGVGLVTSEDEIADIVIKAYQGVPVRIRDVAQVEIGHEIRRGGVTANGKGEAVLGLGFMLMGENSRAVTERLRAKMVEIRRSLPEGVQVQEVYARTDLVDQVLETARDNLFHGAVLVVAALFILGGGLRAGLIVALAIPLSFLFASNLMLQARIAGSLMSLGAIDFGIIVDSSVIMVENSVRHLANNRAGRPVIDVVREASIEVRKPTMFGEAIIMIVYLPILTLVGIEGKLFRPMALVVLFALLGSLVLSLTLMPVLASLILSSKVKDREPWVIRVCQSIYRPALNWVLHNRVAVLVMAVAVIALAGVMATELGTEFIPRLSEQSIVINTVRLASVSLEESLRYSTRMEQILLREFPDEIKHVWSRTGTAEVATDPMGLELTDIFLTLKPREQWQRVATQDELAQGMQAVLGDLPGTRVLFTQPIEMRMNEMIAGIRADVGVKIFGDDFDQLVTLSEQVADVLRQIAGASDVSPDQITGQPTLRIEIDTEAISRHGVARQEVLETIEAIGTLKVGDIRQGQMRFPLAVRLAEAYRDDPESVSHILIPTVDGRRLPLAELAKIERVEGPSTINREWAKRRTLVQCNVRDRDVGSFVKEAREKVGELVKSWPPGYNVAWGGQFEHMQEAQHRLMLVVPLAGFLIFALLYTTFNSVRDALLIFSGVPFAVVGGVIALYLRGMPFSISAGVGFIALLGIAVLNGLVLVSYIRQLTAGGSDLDAAIREAGLVRLRPVLMTAVTDALGFVPMMMATAVGAEVQRPLATVVVGGVISSMLLTLLVLPVLYSLFGHRRL